MNFSTQEYMSWRWSGEEAIKTDKVHHGNGHPILCERSRLVYRNSCQQQVMKSLLDATDYESQ